MSVIAPDFRLSGFLRSILDNVFWIIVLVTLAGIPAIQIILFYIEMPVIDGELLTPFLALTWLADPSRVLPIVKALMTTDIFRIAVFPGFGLAALLAAGTIFVERKMLAKLQLRVGPFYCGKVEGILQLAGDGLKLISKEIIIPAKADKPIFWLAPVAFVGTAAAFVSLIPVAPGGWVVADVELGILAVFAVIGFFPIITILSAWSANSKFPFIGGIRALHQMISFEIPLILSLLGVVMLAGTLNLTGIVESQDSFPWIVFLPVGAVVFFICILAELERIPFDLPEAESEIVAGWLTEFSGMMYGLVAAGHLPQTVRVRGDIHGGIPGRLARPHDSAPLPRGDHHRWHSDGPRNGHHTRPAALRPGDAQWHHMVCAEDRRRHFLHTAAPWSVPPHTHRHAALAGLVQADRAVVH